jgi:hypothetical protein
MALPLAERLEAYGDLVLGAYRVDPPGPSDLGLFDAGAAGAAWAPAMADRLVALFAPGTPHAERNGRTSPPEILCEVVCDALAAAGVPIDERWDAFVSIESKALAVLPAARRDAVIIRALADEFTRDGLRSGLEMIVKYPSPGLTDYLITLADECTASLLCPPRRDYLARLRDTLAPQPELAARVADHLASLPPLPALRCTRKLYPSRYDEMSEGVQQMFMVLGEGWEMISLDDEGEVVFPDPIVYVSAFEIADENGPAFEALMYMDEDGSVCRANTTNQVMMACQMRLSWNIDDLLAEALHAILRERP